MEGEWLVLRQVLWKVPESLLEKSLSLKEDRSRSSSQEKKSWSLTDTSQQQRGEVIKGGIVRRRYWIMLCICR